MKYKLLRNLEILKFKWQTADFSMSSSQKTDLEKLVTSSAHLQNPCFILKRLQNASLGPLQNGSIEIKVVEKFSLSPGSELTTSSCGLVDIRMDRLARRRKKRHALCGGYVRRPASRSISQPPKKAVQEKRWSHSKTPFRS